MRNVEIKQSVIIKAEVIFCLFIGNGLPSIELWDTVFSQTVLCCLLYTPNFVVVHPGIPCISKMCILYT